ncbi:MAG TPA: hypothetical protein VFQ72_00370 [Candidatus Paceibacterota bacterium]|nr:hypothetical protein [Candidatus Paceibacterota bacterium]
MLIKKPQVHIVSREVALATGELVRAFFAVIEAEGLREVRFLGFKPLESETSSPVLALTAPRSIASYGDIFIPSSFEAVSPFSALDFLTSQPARAPSVR